MKHDLTGVRETLESQDWGQGFEAEGPDSLRMDLSGGRSIWIHVSGDIDLSWARNVNPQSLLVKAVRAALAENQVKP